MGVQVWEGFLEANDFGEPEHGGAGQGYSIYALHVINHGLKPGVPWSPEYY